MLRIQATKACPQGLYCQDMLADSCDLYHLAPDEQLPPSEEEVSLPPPSKEPLIAASNAPGAWKASKIKPEQRFALFC